MSGPERALLQLLRLRPGPLASVSEAEWSAILTLARREQVAPLAWAAVRDVCAADGSARLPDEARRGLASAAREAAEIAARAYAELAEVLARLRAAGVRAALLKGAALARFIYRDESLRPLTDLDLLVRPRDLGAAVRVLQAAGYTAAPPPGDPHGRCEQTCYDPSWRRLPVDVHWRYAGEPYPLGIDYAGVFARAEEVAVGGERALLPSPADLLVAVGAHVLHDVWTSTPRVRYLRDAAELARHPVDWRRVLQTAEEAPEARPALWLTLSAATDLLGAPVPRAVIAALAPRLPGAGRWVLARFCGTVLRRASPAESLALVAALRWAGGAKGGYARLAGARIRAQAMRLRYYLRRQTARARRQDPRPWRRY